MPRDQTQIVLDPGRVRAAMGTATPKQVEVLSRRRVSGQVIRRALTHRQITRSLAEHLAEALRVRLADLVGKETTNDVP